MNPPSIRLALVFAVLAAVTSTSYSQASGDFPKTVLNLDIYYESLCPDSIYFITREFAPVYKDFKDFLNVNYVPFGKASWVRGENNELEFTCQHGPSECRGNRGQSCALHEIEQHLRPEDKQQTAFDLVNCAMSSRDPSSAVPQCVAKLGFGPESALRILNCSNSRAGNELLVRNGEKTKAFESPLHFVPSVVINGEKSAGAFKDFKSIICKNIPEGQQPSACGTRS